MDLISYAHMLRRSWVVSVAILIVGIICGVLITLSTAPRYESTAQLYVSARSASTLQDLSTGNTFTEAAVQSYVIVATTPIILDPVIRDLSLNTSVKSLQQQLTVTAATGTTVLTIQASESSPRSAASVANSVADHLRAVVPTISSDIDGGSLIQVTAIQRATPPTSPAAPSLPTNVALGALAGAILALLVTFGRNAFDTKVRGAAQAETASGAPVIGLIPFDRSIASGSDATPDRGTKEAMRSLRTNLRFISATGNPTSSYILTSSIESEGKTTTSINLAIALGETGTRVLLVDADLRRPQIAARLGLVGEIGLSDVLLDDANLQEAVQEWGAETRIRVLPAGKIPPNPSELLQSAAFKRVVNEMQETYDIVLFDMPPLLPVADAVIAAEIIGHVLVVCAYGKVRIPQLRAAIDKLHKAGHSTSAAILTRIPRRGAATDSYAYAGYGYYGDAGGDRGRK